MRKTARDFSLEEKTKAGAHHGSFTSTSEQLSCSRPPEGGRALRPPNIRHDDHLNAALRSPALYSAMSNTPCAAAKSIIVDDSPERTMPCRRWSDGLHQADGGKRACGWPRETQTVASDHLPNYFRLYKKLPA